MKVIVVLFISLLVTILTPNLKKSAFAYGLISGTGRADYADFYDLIPSSMFPGQEENLRYDFGKIGSFSTLPRGLTATDIEVAARNATNDWEGWANVSFGERLGNSGTGLVQLTYDPNPARGNGATTSGFNGSYAQIQFYGNWNRQNFQNILEHELGHVLGLHDLYYGVREDFVDHPVDRNQAVVNGKTYPSNASANQYNDNIMACCAAWSGTVIDNDEIAGVTWMWGGPYNQIVTGDLAKDFKDPLGMR